MAKINEFSVFSSDATDEERAAGVAAVKFVDTIASANSVIDSLGSETSAARFYEASKVAAAVDPTGSASVTATKTPDGVTTSAIASPTIIKAIPAISTVQPFGMPSIELSAVAVSPVTSSAAIKALEAIGTAASVAIPSVEVEKAIVASASIGGLSAIDVNTAALAASAIDKAGPAASTPASGAASTNSMDISMNLAGVAWYATQHAFIDRFKTSSQFVAQYANGQQGSEAIALDANGYPQGMPAGAVNMIVGVDVDPSELAMPDVYVLLYKGNATFHVNGGTVISSEPGKLVFSYSGGAGTTINISSIDANNPITEMHLVRQDQMALYEAGEIFNPAFLDKASQWSELRYMEWGNTNYNKLTTWEQRTTVDSATWSGIYPTSSVPIEIMVALANKTKTDMWINIPAEAGDDYVRKTLAYVRDHLDSSLKVKVEYSNEVWNWGFQQTHYARDMGDKLFGTDINGNGQIDPGTSEVPAGGYLLYYGYRAAQIAAIGNSVFAGDASGRLSNVISTQTSYPGLEEYVFDGVARANAGSVSSLFKDYAITTYFGLDTVDSATIVSWARSGQAGLDAVFSALGDALTDNLRLYVYQQAVAAQNGLSLIGYEGGLALISYIFPEADQDAVLAFYKAIGDDPRIGDLYTRMIADFAASGASSLSAYDDAADPSRFGTWGTLDSIYDETSPRYAALVAASQAAQANHGNGLDPTQPNVVTSAASYALNATQLTLTYTGSGGFNGRGNDLANTIVGGNSFNLLYGGGGNDTLVGGNRNDILDGGTGADRMVGGTGNDIYSVDNAGDLVVELAGGGTDEVRTTLNSYVLTANVENLTFQGSGAVTGTGNELDNVITASTGPATLSGGAGRDTLIGSAGADTLDGGTGADIMRGGMGNDTYIVDNAGDDVIELAGGGLDTVRTTLNRYVLPGQVENLTFTGVGNFDAFGNTLDNFIIGAAGNDTLWGDAGNDTLYGRAGNDTLIGGLGADLMNGGAGDDRYEVDNIGDVVVELANLGYDTVVSSISYTLTDNVEALMLTGTDRLNGTGNSLNNTISGNDADNWLIGGAGDDWLYANGGNDQVDGGEGNDVLYGGDGNDVMYGRAGNDSLYGGAGNDVLYGGLGKDILDGGAGADRYVFFINHSGPTRATADLVVFSHDEGDIIDLTPMDARTSTSTRDAFNFIGQSDFTRTAGELRIQYSGGYWDVMGDTNGDGIADFSITVLAGSTPLIARDFIL